MGFLKWLAGLFFTLLIIGILASLFMHKNMEVEEEIVINRPISEVYYFIQSLDNVHKVSEFHQRDNDAKRTAEGIDGQVGYTVSWSGNKSLGKGEEKIKRVEPNRIETEVKYKKYLDGKKKYI